MSSSKISSGPQKIVTKNDISLPNCVPPRITPPNKFDRMNSTPISEKSINLSSNFDYSSVSSLSSPKRRTTPVIKSNLGSSRKNTGLKGNKVEVNQKKALESHYDEYLVSELIRAKFIAVHKSTKKSVEKEIVLAWRSYETLRIKVEKKKDANAQIESLIEKINFCDSYMLTMTSVLPEMENSFLKIQRLRKAFEIIHHKLVNKGELKEKEIYLIYKTLEEKTMKTDFPKYLHELSEYAKDTSALFTSLELIDNSNDDVREELEKAKSLAIQTKSLMLSSSSSSLLPKSESLLQIYLPPSLHNKLVNF